MKTTPTKVLLLDENPADLSWLQQLTSPAPAAGLEWDYTDQPDTARRRAAEGKMGLVLLALPRAEGPAIIQSLQAHVPVVLLAHTEQEALPYLQAGARDVVWRDGLDVVTLVSTLRSAAAQDRLVRQLEQANRELLGWKTNFRSIIDDNADSIVVVDRRGTIRFANPAAERLFGQPAEQLVGATFGFPVVAGETTELDIVRGSGQRVVAEMRMVEAEWDGETAYLASLRDVTARKESENRLRQLLRAVEQSASIVFITDMQGRIEYANPKFTEVTGYMLEEVIGQNPRVLKSGMNPPEKYSQLWQTIMTGGEWRGELLNRKKNGDLYWVSASMSPIKDADGTTTHFLAIEEDITERKQAVEALRAERDLINAVLETVGALIIVLDPQGHIVRFNRACEQITGYSFEEVKGKHFADLFLNPEEVDQVKAVFNDLRTGKFPNHHENYWRTRDGQKRFIAWSNTVLLNPDGTVGYIIGTGIDITERRAAEATLRQSEARFRAIFESAPMGMALTDANGHFWDTNPALQALLGYTGDELRQMTRVDISHPDDVEPTTPPFLDMYAGKHNRYQLEKRYIRKDGEVVWVRLTAALVQSGSEILPLSIGIVEDITKQRQAEQAEREQRALADALRDMAAALNSTLDLDEVLERLLSDVARVVPHDLATIMLLDDQGRARVVRSSGFAERGLDKWVAGFSVSLDEFHNLRKVIEIGQPLIVEDTLADPTWVSLPQTAWIRSHADVPIRRGGEVIGFLNLDSAEPHFFTQKQVERLQTFADQASVAIWNARLYEEVRHHAAELEDRVAQRTSELAQQRALLQAILDAMGEGVFYANRKNEIQYINRAFAKLIGYSTEEMLSRPFEIYRSVTASIDDIETWLSQVSEVIERGGTWRGEVRLRRRDGSEFDASATVTSVMGPDGELIGRVELIRDISQEKALQAQRERFIANASHELRTPLTNIKMRLYLIRKQPYRLNEHLGVMEQVVERMEDLVDDLLDLSRFERGVILLERRETALQEVLFHVVNVQLPHAESKNIRLTLDMPDKPLLVNADSKRLIQVFTNLITNAINYTPAEGTIRVCLQEQRERDHRYAVIQVQDSGVGIPPDALPHVFEPFFRVADNTIKGTGLGLSISKEIIELHGGEISVSSVVEKGSTFRVRLTLKQEEGRLITV